tara:strand:+ start:200 stop:391 length:192 start_codon:yes stop_codon:yes gene_type:complete
MAISKSQNKSLKNSLVPNSIMIIVENHNGAISYQEAVPPMFFHGTMKRLKEKYSYLYKIYTVA